MVMRSGWGTLPMSRFHQFDIKSDDYFIHGFQRNEMVWYLSVILVRRSNLIDWTSGRMSYCLLNGLHGLYDEWTLEAAWKDFWESIYLKPLEREVSLGFAWWGYSEKRAFWRQYDSDGFNHALMGFWDLTREGREVLYNQKHLVPIQNWIFTLTPNFDGKIKRDLQPRSPFLQTSIKR